MVDRAGEKQKHTADNETAHFRYETAIAATPPNMGVATEDWWSPADKALAPVVGGLGWDSVSFGIVTSGLNG